MIGKPFIATSATPSKRSKIVRESTPEKNIVLKIKDPTTADDFYSVVKSSYDTNLIDKGFCSSTPVTIAVIPFTKLTQENNAEADILNIQRNLDTIATSNVNEIINNLTGTLSAELNSALDDRSQIDTFRSAVSKITAAYNSKATYMTHLASPYAIETNSDFNYNFSPGGTETGIPNEIVTSKITSFENKIDWIESYLKISNSNLNSGYNIKNILQIVRNSFARKIYGPNFSTTGESSSLYVNPIDLTAFNTAAQFYFGDLSSVNGESTLNLSDDNTDILIAADAKSVSYTRSGVNFESEASALIGDLSSYASGLNLSRSTNVGIFTSLLGYEEEGKSVLSLDVNVNDQTTLQTYESADEFFLGLPLANDKTLLTSRSNTFSANAQTIESSIASSFSRIILDPEDDLFSFNCFLSQMKYMIEDSFYTTNNTTSIMRFILMMASLNDTETRKRIFKVMMLRDRLINSGDYTTPDSKNSFETKARSELDLEVYNLIKHIIPEYGEPVPSLRNANPGDETQEAASDIDIRAQDDLIIERIKTSLGFTVSSAAAGTRSPVEFESEESDTAGRDMLDALATGLNDPTSHQWDNFFKAARNVEAGSSNFLKTSRTSSSASVLTARVGQTNTMTMLTRDERAFLFFNKWLSIIGDFTFKVEYEVDTDSSISSGTTRSIITKVYYKNQDYDSLKGALSLTLSGIQSLDSYTYYFNYIQPLASVILQDGQAFYDGIDYVYRFIMQTSSLLGSASSLAYAYTPAYGENLSNHYTSNAVLNLNRQSKLAFSSDATYKNFSKDQYKNSNTLNGFLRYIQEDSEVSVNEDSLVLVCGIPYGMLDRLGAFNQRNLGYVDVTITLRPIGGSTVGDAIVTKTYPISGYIEHQYLNYDTTSNASYQQVLDATSLYELNSNRVLTVNEQFDETSKKNELQSTALLNYLQLFYGLTFDYSITNQVLINDITDSNTILAIDKLKNAIYDYRFDEIVESRYVSAGVNSLRFSRSNIITKALGAGVFDKVVAIPIDSAILKGSSEGYLVDILLGVSTRFVERTEPIITRTVTQVGNNLVSNLQSTIRQNVTSTVTTLANLNVRGTS